MRINGVVGAPAAAINCMCLTIKGQRHYPWRAVDHEGNILNISVQHRREKQTVKTFFRKLLKGCQSVPQVIVTGKLGSYGRGEAGDSPSR